MFAANKHISQFIPLPKTNGMTDQLAKFESTRSAEHCGGATMDTLPLAKATSIKAPMVRLVAWLTTTLLLATGCSAPPHPTIPDHEITTRWANLTLFITKTTPANTPTFAARCLGYIGLTMYESIVAGHPDYNSLAGQLNGLPTLPVPAAGQAYDWRLALNAGQAAILRSIYNQTSDENKAKIDSLEQVILENIAAQQNDKALIDRSVAHGKAVAAQIFEWSKSDGGHRGYLKNFDKEYVHPERPGAWKPALFSQSFSHHPLHPHWGENRTFLKATAEMETPPMIPFDSIKGSPYYQQMLAVYEKNNALTTEEKQTAIWWADDPDSTFTPPGHSYFLASLVIDQKKPSLIECAATYAHLGMALSDAYVACWKWKYQYFSERPNAYITQYIDQRWESFWPDPPFPAFPSGHAIQGGAAAEVLTHLFGDHYTFDDRSHEGRWPDEIRETKFVGRSFKTFYEMAEQCAYSRFLGGIHTPQDNETGLREGRKIAGIVNGLRWKK